MSTVNVVNAPSWRRRALRIAAALAVAALAAILRLRAVALLPIDYDEDDYLRGGLEYAAAIQRGDWAALTQLNYRPEHPALHKLAYGLALAPFPPATVPDRPTTAAPAPSLPQPHLYVARLVSAFFGTLQVLVLALISPVAGLFLAISTWAVKYTSQAMLEGIPSFTSLLVVACYARGRIRGWRWLALSGAALGLTAASKYLYCVAGAAVAVHWLASTAPRRGARSKVALWRWLRPVLLWAVLAVAVFAAADPYLWPDPVGRLRDSVFFHPYYTQSQAVQSLNMPFWQTLALLFSSVPWHRSVFLVALDPLVTLLAAIGLFGRKEPRLWVTWLVVAAAFLLVWPTKWPQYLLCLLAPVCYLGAAALARWVAMLERAWAARGDWHWRPAWPSSASWIGLRRALPWLIPGLAAAGLLLIYPMIYQFAISLTDLQATSIRDGVTGGVWREVWLGLTGQVSPVTPSALGHGPATRVHYAGPGLLAQVLLSIDEVLAFEIVWTVLAVGTQAALGLGVALLLNRRGVRFTGWWRTLYILPWAVPEFVAALSWSHILEPRFGWLRLATAPWAQQAPALARASAGWMARTDQALLLLLMAALWYGFPFMCLAASAGLRMIPHELHEAAWMDGAGAWTRFRYVTWPLLAPLLVPALLIRAIGAFNQFYLFVVLRPPHPLATLATISYTQFASNRQYAVSAAINTVTVAILLGLVLWFEHKSRASEGLTYA
ncbi:MAG: ABC transporter permease subunit [Chloroflexi bacterium]|nr:ABC transporter permease subunit [Chloroflexota bacterium]